MKKLSLFKALSIATTISACSIPFYSCGTKCPGHVKGELLAVSPDKVEGFELPGVYRCKNCGGEMIDEMELQQIGLNSLFLNGDLTGISKDNKVNITCEYKTLDGQGDFAYDCTLKWQGKSSVHYDKKNFNMVLYEKDSSYQTKKKIKLVDSWPEDSKYTLKANWIDVTNARNIVSAKIWGDLIHQRGKEDELNKTLNGGAIDGFPICLFINGRCEGLYTLNIAKGNGQFNMSKSAEAKQCFISSKNLTYSSLFLEKINPALEQWEIQYCNKDDESWVYPSFNTLIDFVLNSSDDEFKQNLNQYLDIDRTIDYFIFLIASCLVDNVGQNINWVTYDGTHWFPCAYDLDSSFGLWFNGQMLVSYSFMPRYKWSKLFTRLYKHFYLDITAQYKIYRQKALSNENVTNKFVAFCNSVPQIMTNTNLRRWPKIPSQDTNTLENIKAFIQNRFQWLDDLWK